MKKSLLVIPVIVVILINGCSSTSSSESKSPTPKIGATIYKYDDKFMSYVRKSIENEAKGKAILTIDDSQNDQSKQNDQVDTLISKGVKSLAINLVDPKAAQDIVDKAKAAKLPVVFFNKEPDVSVLSSYDKAYYVGTNSSEAGILQGQMIAKLWAANKDKWDKNKDGVLNYVLLKGELGQLDAEARTKYSIEEVKKAGIQVKELALDTAMWDATKATAKMDAWLSKYKSDIEFVIANNDDMALGAVASLEKNGYTGNKTLPVVGVDAIPDALNDIKSGKMVGTVLNDAKNQGKATFNLALNLANEKDPVGGTSWKLDNKAVRIPYIAITKDNLSVGEAAYK